jgi:spermidine synthase
MQLRNRGWIILALFFCSGATALVYEVVWSKFLSQMFGSTVYAQTAVLATFMGGLALGNKVFGRWADGLAHPVRAYGWLELGIGIYAILFPLLDRLVDRVFVAVGSGLIEHPGWLLVLKGTLSALLLITPTVLMGGTLPLMAAWLQKSDSDDAGRRSARFYSVNSLGAVTGSALAGFFLVQTFGMITTLWVAALVNALVGLIAILISGKIETVSSAPAQSTTPLAGAGGELAGSNPITRITPAVACLIVALTGAISMGLEVLASRSLVLIFGSSLQAFAAVLIAFILGIGLGAAWIASPTRQIRSSEGLVVVLLALAGAWVAFLVFNIESWVDFYRLARTGIARTPAGYIIHQLLTLVISLIVLGIPAAAIGAVLPLLIRAISGGSVALGKSVGVLLTWNTLGCVVGVLITGFGLMPALGLRNAYAVLALVLVFAAFALAVRCRLRIGGGLSLAAVIFVTMVMLQSDQGWKHVMGSGVFRIWETQVDPQLMAKRKEHVKILFYEDGPDATVSVEQWDGADASARLSMSINGKVEAGTTSADMGTQLLCSHLGMFVKPDAKDVFVLGLASGMTATAPLAYPIERLDVAENCEPVIKASQFFEDWNCHVLSDPRTKLWREDGRTVLKLNPQLYDVIITEPSNPWFVGTGSVFSKEYYELAASRLKPGGIVSQWVQLYETQDEIVELILRTFRSVFPHMELWDVGNGDVIMLGALQPWDTGPEVFRKGFAFERVRQDMEMINIFSPETLMVRQLASQQTAFAIPGKGPIQSDRFPLLEYIAPKAFFLGAGSKMLFNYDERTHLQLLAPPSKRATLASIPIEQSQLVLDEYSTINQQLWGCLYEASLGDGVPCALPTPKPSPPPATSGTIIAFCQAAIAQGDWRQADQLASYALAQEPNNLDAAYLKRIIDRRLGRAP